METMIGRRSLFVFAVAAALVVGGAALASIPDPTGVIHSCYSQSLGTWRPIDIQAGQKCKSGETALDFNQKGIAGAQGPAGPDGSTGPAGKDGTSVTSSTLAAGNTNCPNGGSSFTSATGTTYACNGANGKDGASGTNGTSITTSTEPVGSNCPNGGASFSDGVHTTYACNGLPGGDAADGVSTLDAELPIEASNVVLATVAGLQLVGYCPSGKVGGGIADMIVSNPSEGSTIFMDEDTGTFLSPGTASNIRNLGTVHLLSGGIAAGTVNLISEPTPGNPFHAATITYTMSTTGVAPCEFEAMIVSH